MVPLGDMAQVEACFGPFRHFANLDHKIGALFASNVPQARKSFWTHPMELLGDVGHVNLASFHLETVFVLVQDRCTVCSV